MLIKLGAGESGKSTIAKQMRIIFLEGFTEEERVHFKEVIYSNMLGSMISMLNAVNKFELQLEDRNKVISMFIWSLIVLGKSWKLFIEHNSNVQWNLRVTC